MPRVHLASIRPICPQCGPALLGRGLPAIRCASAGLIFAAVVKGLWDAVGGSKLGDLVVVGGIRQGDFPGDPGMLEGSAGVGYENGGCLRRLRVFLPTGGRLRRVAGRRSLRRSCSAGVDFQPVQIAQALVDVLDLGGGQAC